jgi:hypothetical protein
MNLVLFASGGLCWRNTQSDRSAGEIVELIRRFWFTGLVFVFLLADSRRAESDRSPRAGAGSRDPQRNRRRVTAQSYNEARAEYARSLYLIDATVGNNL